MKVNLDGAGRTSLQDTDETVRHLAGKYLTFKLENETLAIGILWVNQIIPLQEIATIPRLPSFIRGVINLRGSIIPIIDLRKKLDMCSSDDTARSCIVVIQRELNGVMTYSGVVIDEVREVIEIQAEEIDPTPDFGAGVSTDFIMGIAKTARTVTLLLDIVKILSSSENRTLAELSEKLT